MAGSSELPLMMTLEVSVEVEKIGHSGSTGQIPRIMQILEHYAAYPNNMTKVLVAIKNMCLREDSWVVRVFLKSRFPQVIAKAIVAHSSNGSFISRACEVISAVSHIVKEPAVSAFVDEGVLTGLLSCLTILEEDAPAVARILQSIGFLAANGNQALFNQCVSGNGAAEITKLMGAHMENYAIQAKGAEAIGWLCNGGGAALATSCVSAKYVKQATAAARLHKNELGVQRAVWHSFHWLACSLEPDQLNVFVDFDLCSVMEIATSQHLKDAILITSLCDCIGWIASNMPVELSPIVALMTAASGQLLKILQRHCELQSVVACAEAAKAMGCIAFTGMKPLLEHLHSIGIVSILTDALGAFDSMDDAKHAGAASDLSSAADSKSPTLSQIHNLSCQVAYTFNWLCFNGGALLCTAVVESSRTVEALVRLTIAAEPESDSKTGLRGPGALNIEAAVNALEALGWVARFFPQSALSLIRAQALMNVIDLLDEQEAVVLVEACFHFLQWLLSAGGKEIWIEDDDDVEPLFTGEVMACVVKWMTDDGEVGRSLVVQTRGCAIVGSFLYGGESKAEKLARLKKAVDCVFVAMGKFESNEDVQYQCCSTVGAFARFGGVDMSNALQRANAGELLLKALQKFATSNKGVLWTCCSALKLLAETNRGNLRALRKLKAAKALIQARDSAAALGDPNVSKQVKGYLCPAYLAITNKEIPPLEVEQKSSRPRRGSRLSSPRQ